MKGKEKMDAWSQMFQGEMSPVDEEAVRAKRTHELVVQGLDEGIGPFRYADLSLLIVSLAVLFLLFLLLPPLSCSISFLQWIQVRPNKQSSKLRTSQH